MWWGLVAHAVDLEHAPAFGNRAQVVQADERTGGVPRHDREPAVQVEVAVVLDGLGALERKPPARILLERPRHATRIAPREEVPAVIGGRAGDGPALRELGPQD